MNTNIELKSSGDNGNTSALCKAGQSQSWYQGRDTAMVKRYSYSGYNAITSMKTTNGSWEMGVYSNNEMYFTYITDANYSSKNNVVTSQSKLCADTRWFGAKGLWENLSSGSNGTITLSETAANFSYIEIYFSTNDNKAWTNCCKVYSPNGRSAVLVSMYPTGNTYVKGRVVTISGTSIATSGSQYGQLWNGGHDTSNTIYITRVVGYK